MKNPFNQGSSLFVFTLINLIERITLILELEIWFIKKIMLIMKKPFNHGLFTFCLNLDLLDLKD